jgi:FixJ family two-component response regulator
MVPQTQQSGKRPFVILIDDDPAVLNSVRFSLEIDGYAVMTFRDGGTLLNVVNLPPESCLVVDQIMPDLTGLDLVERLQKRGDRLPTILLTSYASPSLRERASRLGVSIVEKPLFGSVLVNAIESAAGRIRS